MDMSHHTPGANTFDTSDSISEHRCWGGREKITLIFQLFGRSHSIERHSALSEIDIETFIIFLPPHKC